MLHEKFKFKRGSELSELMTESNKKLQVKLTSIAEVGDDIYRYEFKSLDGAMLPRFSGGSHIDIHIQPGLIRQYSLCNDPAESNRYVIAVQLERNGKGGSKALHETAKISQKYQISSPRNNFSLILNEKKYLLIGGGIGITPLLAMAAELSRNEADFHLHYCTRNDSKVIQSSILKKLIAQGKATLHLDNGNPADGINLTTTLKHHSPGEHLYFCGPTGFMNAIKNAASHWPKEFIHFEHFSPPSIKESLATQPNSEFLVILKRSKLEFAIGADESITDVLRKNDFFIETSCEEGYCGTCLTRYLEGVPDHRDTVLSDKDKESFLMICCSRAKSAELVLDL